MVHSPHRSPSRDSFPRPQSSASYRIMAFSFVGVAVLVVIGALWISSVQARVTIHTKHDSVSQQIVIELAKSPDQGQLSGRVVEGTFDKIQEFSVQPGDGQTATGPAKGTVKIINNYSRPQTLIAKTRLLTSDGKLYRIDKTVEVAPKQSVTVSAHSDQEGSQFSLESGVKMTIPGLWIDIQKWIYAETATPFAPSTSSGKVVSASDVTNAQKALEDAVFEQAKKTLMSEANVGTDWDGIFTKKVLETKSNMTPGQQADSFLASVRLDVTGVFYPKQDMELLVKQKLRERFPDGRELVNFDPSAIVYSIDQLDVKQEHARVSVTAQAESRLTENSPSIAKEAFMGLSLEEARSKLSGVDGVQSVDIQIQPSWIGKIPTSKDHIQLIVQ